MKALRRSATLIIALVTAMCLPALTVYGSSHMDAPLITFDDPANTTDVYAFVSEGRGSVSKYLTTALGVYPFEEPGIGPNKYTFDDNVLYQIHVATGKDLTKGKATFSYEFKFQTRFKRQDTILQAFLGVIHNIHDDNQNLRQTYKVTKVDRGYDGKDDDDDDDGGRRDVLGEGRVPPNNQGRLTPKYNQGNIGDNPAKEGVDNEALLDDYTKQAITELEDGHRAFAGQRDDGFYADIQSIFDLDFTFTGPNKPFDSQGGFNIHTIVLQIPVEEIGGDQQVVGVFATTSRRKVTVLRGGDGDDDDDRDQRTEGRFVQVGRQGNPLFCEALVAIRDKDLYNQSRPTIDKKVFRRYALTPELAAALGAPVNLRTNRTDIAGIFIPDLIKVDLSTDPARLAGIGVQGFNRLSIFGGDTLLSTVQPGFGGGVIPGGWPNGRRFGDDVVDIAVIALLSDLRTSPPIIFGAPNTAGLSIDKVDYNDISYNKVMPYAATPLNGRSHRHPG
jgi:hypothetical protein